MKYSLSFVLRHTALFCSLFFALLGPWCLTTPCRLIFCTIVVPLCNGHEDHIVVPGRNNLALMITLIKISLMIDFSRSLALPTKSAPSSLRPERKEHIVRSGRHTIPSFWHPCLYPLSVPTRVALARACQGVYDEGAANSVFAAECSGNFKARVTARGEIKKSTLRT